MSLADELLADLEDAEMDGEEAEMEGEYQMHDIDDDIDDIDDIDAVDSGKHKEINAESIKFVARYICGYIFLTSWETSFRATNF